jgi:uncharacterized membrane protein
MKLRAAIAAVALVGAGVAAYLTYVHYANLAPICVNGGCEKVQHSSYATLAGAPVALLGLAAWLLVLGSALFRGATASFAGSAIAMVALVFSGYLLWAQLGPIGAVCQWCLGNDVAVTIVCVLCVGRVLSEPEVESVRRGA